VQAAPETLLALRAALLTRPDLDTVFALRDAGYAGGDTVYAAFTGHLRDSGIDISNLQDLAVDQFFHQAGEFFTKSGWGRTALSAMDDSFCLVEIEQCWEADPAHQPDPRGCHLTVGLLGAFLGKFADYPVAVLEIEGPGTGSGLCRFIAGNTEMVSEYYARNS
jgi:predicted hydrocarbon binding protein